MTDEEISAKLLGFIRKSFLAGDPKNELSEKAPLLEWGVLNSLNTMMLLAFVRDELGVEVSPMNINAKNFKDISNITAMIRGSLAVANT